MSTGSSGCVLRNLFTCEKKCNSLEARKALLEDFTSKIYNAEVVYVDNDGKTTEEEYGNIFQLPENQNDSEMIRVHGNAFLQFGKDEPIKASWSGIYLEKKHGYKMRLIGDNIEKEFYLYCGGNDEINFSIKKTASGDTTVRQLSNFVNNISRNGIGKLGKLQLKLDYLYYLKEGYKNGTLNGGEGQVKDQIYDVEDQILKLYYAKYKKIPARLITRANLVCGCAYPQPTYCQDPQVNPYEECFGGGGDGDY
jgi:hypothetical protein